jgi:hypothetical protein
MSAPRSRVLQFALLGGLLLLARPISAAEWEYLSMDGINSNCVVVDAENRRVFVGTMEGFHYLDIPDGIWTERDWEDWIGREVYSIAGNPAHPLRVVTGRENAFFKGYIELSDDLGLTEHNVYNSNGGSVVDIDFRPWYPPEDHYYACTWPDVVRGEFVRSTDGGATWTLMPPTHHYAMTAIAVDPNSAAIYLAGDQRVTRSYDEGETWVPAWDGLPLGQIVHCLAADPGSELVYEEHMFAGNDTGLYEAMLVYGEPWRQILDQGSRRVAMVAWYHEMGPYHMPAVITTDGRVLVARGGWVDETGNLAGLEPVDLAYCWFDHMLYVATATSGVFRAPFGGWSGIEDPGLIGAGPTAAPNPFRPGTRLAFTLPEPGPASLEVLDVTGRRIATLLDGWQTAGRHEIVWRPWNTPAGVYFARLSAAGNSGTLRLLRLR